MRLIDEKGEQLGVFPIQEAIQRAENVGLDLVEISPNAEPPVCKILDYGKYKFQKQKKAAEAKKNQQVVALKEVVIRPRTEENDYQVKLRNARRFLERGDKVKVNMRFRGREITNQELGMEMMQRFGGDLEDIAKIDQQPRMDGRFMVMMLSPDTTKK